LLPPLLNKQIYQKRRKAPEFIPGALGHPSVSRCATSVARSAFNFSAVDLHCAEYDRFCPSSFNHSWSHLCGSLKL